MSDAPTAPPGAVSSRWRLVLAFAAVYLIWGSTYLAIRFAIDTLPPFLMAGARFLVAGGILYAWARLRGAGRPRPRQWGAAVTIGGFLLLGGNGLVVWAEHTVPSGVAALLVAFEPMWIVLLDWLPPRPARPGAATLAGLFAGLGGVALLVGPWEVLGASIDPWGSAAIILGALLWAIGSLYSRRAPLPDSPTLSTGMQMLAGGALLTTLGLGLGEPGRFDPSSFSLLSLAALGYLIVFGSIIAFTSYVWLLRNAPAHRVATYAYVNPLVAVFLGWALAGEPLTPRTLFAAAVILGSVALLAGSRTRGGDLERKGDSGRPGRRERGPRPRRLRGMFSRTWGMHPKAAVAGCGEAASCSTAAPPAGSR